MYVCMEHAYAKYPEQGYMRKKQNQQSKPALPPSLAYRIFPIRLFAIFIFPSTLSTSPSTSSNNAF